MASTFRRFAFCPGVESSRERKSVYTNVHVASVKIDQKAKCFLIDIQIIIIIHETATSSILSLSLLLHVRLRFVIGCVCVCICLSFSSVQAANWWNIFVDSMKIS